MRFITHASMQACSILLSVSILGFSAVACKTMSDSSVKVANGQKDTQSFPGVVELVTYSQDGKPMWRCTGSVVSRDLILTAAHCLTPADRIDHIQVRGIIAPFDVQGGVKAERFWTPPDYRNEGAVSHNDVGFVQLPQNSAPVAAIMNLSSLPAAPDMPVTLIGYGIEAADTQSGGSIRRSGHNVVDDLDSVHQYRIIVKSLDQRNFTNLSQTMPGDSGGPLLSPAGEILGIVGKGRTVVRDVPYVFYNNIHATDIARFILKSLPGSFQSRDLVDTPEPALSGKPVPSDKLLVTGEILMTEGLREGRVGNNPKFGRGFEFQVGPGLSLYSHRVYGVRIMLGSTYPNTPPVAIELNLQNGNILYQHKSGPSSDDGYVIEYLKSPKNGGDKESYAAIFGDIISSLRFIQEAEPSAASALSYFETNQSAFGLN